MNAMEEMRKAEADAKAKGIPRARAAFKPIEGRTWNPALNFPPNAECFCGSNKKFKKCHRNSLSRTVTDKEAVALQVLVKEAEARHKAEA